MNAARIAAIALASVVCAACGPKWSGDYQGTLTGTCGISAVSNQHLDADGKGTATVKTCSGGSTTDGFVLKVRDGKDEGKIVAEILGCSIVLTRKDMGAEVDSGQSCAIDVDGYRGPTTPTGSINLTDSGKRVSLQLYLAATAHQTSGAYVLTMEGTRH